MEQETNPNKRQFWTYKRIHSARNKNAKNTRKIFHEINGKIATDRSLTRRLDNLYIPPAYKDLVVAKSATNKIQVIGTDKRGRRQYIYNSNYVAKRDERKYDDIMSLGKNIISIENDNQRALYNLLDKSKSQLTLPNDYIPVIIYMLRKYHFRIGNERYVNQNDSYGITTLQSRHIKFNTPTKFTISFVGKKGIQNEYTDDNETMAKILKMLISNSSNTNTLSTPKSRQYLFAYKSPIDDSQQLITPEHIQEYFNAKYKSYITPKMFRTWYGNYHMLEHLRELLRNGQLKPRMQISDIKNTIKSCSEYVSSKLNNTPTISKKSYIDNKLIELVMKNPKRIAEQIPESKEDQHKFLYKLILKLRK